MIETTPMADSSQPRTSTTGPTGARSAVPARWAVGALLAIACLAGAAGSEAIHRTQGLFHVDPGRLGMPPHPPSIEREMLLYTIANHAVGFGLLGLLICGGLGFVWGALVGSYGTAVRALVVGGSFGLFFGAAGGAAAFVAYESLVAIPLDALFKAMLIHLPNWLLLACALAIVVALFRRHGISTQRLFVSALVAGSMAALLYPLLAVVLFTAANSDRPIPSGLGLRLLCFVLGGIVLAIVASRWLRSVAPSAE